MSKPAHIVLLERFRKKAQKVQKVRFLRFYPCPQSVRKVLRALVLTLYTGKTPKKHDFWPQKWPKMAFLGFFETSEKL